MVTQIIKSHVSIKVTFFEFPSKIGSTKIFLTYFYRRYRRASFRWERPSETRVLLLVSFMVTQILLTLHIFEITSFNVFFLFINSVASKLRHIRDGSRVSPIDSHESNYYLH